MARDWLAQDEIDTAFYTMKGLDEMSADLPAACRSEVAAHIGAVFGLKVPAGTSDKEMRQLFVFARMKLDTFGDPKEARAEFTQALMRGFSGAPAPAATRPSASIVEPAAAAPLPGTQVTPATSLPPAQAGPRQEPDATSASAGAMTATGETRAPAPQAATRPAAHARRAAPARPRSSGPLQAPVAHRPSLCRDVPGTPEPLGASFMSLLLPSPSPKDPQALSRWVSGQPWAEGCVAIAFPSDPANTDRIMEEEAEMSQNRSLYLQRQGVIEVSGPNKTLYRCNARGHAQWLQDHAEEVSAEALDRFAKALGDAIGLFSEEKQEMLRRTGAVLVSSPTAALHISAAFRLEGLFLADTPYEDGRHEQNILGNLSPERRMEPGIALRRAAFMHVATGMDLADALVEGLADLRLAQAMRIAEEDHGPEGATQVFNRFDQVFFEDCGTALRDYTVCENIDAPSM